MKTIGFRLLTPLWLAAVCVLPGCASLQSVSITAIPRDRSHVVTADEDNVAFLGNGFADPLRDRLKAQCPHGQVTGIFTKYESVWYFLVQKREITATGYCVEAEESPPTAARASLGPRGSEGS